MFLSAASVIRSFMAFAVASQEVCARTPRILMNREERSDSLADNAFSHAATNSLGVFPRYTISPYGSATSVMGVLTIGRSAAIYSRVLVGLMNLVDAFLAK